MEPPWGCHSDSPRLRNCLGHIDKEWALATASPCRPQTSPAGTLLVPLSSVAPLLRRIDPLWGLCPPLPSAAAPPLSFQRVGFQKSFSSGPAGAKNSEEWRAICLQIVRRYRNRPEGGMLATEYYARV